MTKKRLAAISAIAFLLLPTVSIAAENLKQRALRGLKGVYVTIESLKPEVERLGLSKDQIKTDVELRLRKAKVRVLTEKERLEMPEMPVLYVNISTSISSGDCACSVIVELMEWVTLANGLQTLASIWNTGVIGSVGTKEIREIREKVKDQVDKFINDYLAANPK